MSRPPMRRAGLLRRAGVLALAILLAACGGPQLPPPEGPAGPTDAPPNGSDLPDRPPDGDGSAGVTDLLEPHAQPLVPGLYLPAGFLARGTDHYAIVLTQLSCDELAAVLDAGQWKVENRVAWPLPTPNPAEGIPELPSTDWLFLRSGSETAIARIGGDADGCAAQVWRVSRQPFTASGAWDVAGEASAIQAMCTAVDGAAGFMTTYIGPGDLRFSIQGEVPLELGTHPLDENTEVAIGRSPSGLFEFFQAIANPEGGGLEEAGFEEWYFDHEDPAEWGSVTVTSIEPLIGEITFRNLTDERGRGQSLTAGFRCDLPAGQLARAAEAPRATREPDVEETPPPAGRLVVTVASGRHAGRHEIESSNISCAFNLLGGDTWNAGYFADHDLRPGEIETLNVDMPAGGGPSSALVTFGDDFDHDWFSDNSATGQLSDVGSIVEFIVSGRSAAGIAFEITITCTDVGRF